MKKLAALCVLAVASQCFAQKHCTPHQHTCDAFNWQLTTIPEAYEVRGWPSFEVGALSVPVFRNSKTWTAEELALLADSSIPPITVKPMSFEDCGGDAVPDDLDGCFDQRSWTIFIAPRLLK